MLVIDFDEKKCYYYRKDLAFTEDFVIEFCKEHLKNDYQEETIKDFIDRLEYYTDDAYRSNSFFLMKEKTLYYLNWGWYTRGFSKVKYPFWKIPRASKWPVAFKYCFYKCCDALDNLIKTYTQWTEFCDLPEIPRIEIDIKNKMIEVRELNDSLSEDYDMFSDILSLSLKGNLKRIVHKEISQRYQEIYIKENPIMIVSRKYGGFIRRYVVFEDLTINEIEFSSMGEILESTINNLVVEDNQFMINRIYNYILWPGNNIEPDLRIKEINWEYIKGDRITQKNAILTVKPE